MRKKYTQFRPRIRSRHPSHDILRSKFKNLPLLPFRSLVRLGSTTELNEENRVVLNSITSIKNSSNKLLMKECFTEHDVKTADWWLHLEGYSFVKQSNGESQEFNIEDLPYPIIAKSKFGSRGRGNYKLDTVSMLSDFINSNNSSNYIFEKYYNYNREYRLHVDKEGCFYTCRKMLKSDTIEGDRWFRNDSNSIWVLEDNELFDRPVNWDDIVNQSVLALNSIGLDFGAIDLRIQSAKNRDGDTRDYPEFIVIEINSAPSFGSITSEKYIEKIPELLKKKYNERTN